MRTLVTFLVLTTSANLSAQPLIDSTWLPKPGDNFILQGANYNELPYNIYGDTGITLGGNNVLWNFDKLQLLNNFDTIRLTGTTSDLVRTDMNGAISLCWYRDALYECGYPIIYYQFPLDTAIVNQFGSNTNSYFNGVRYNGWGNLTLPGNIHYGNVLMLEQYSGSQEVEYYNDGEDPPEWPLSATD